MKAKLFRSGADRGKPIAFGAEAIIGRGGESTVRLESSAVSSCHARIYFDADRGRYYLEDLDSLNGTKLDGVEVRRAEPLERLHVLEFGGDGVEFVFQALDLTPAAEAEGGEPSAPAAATAGTAVEREMPELPPSLEEDAAAGDAALPVDGTAVDRELPEVPQALLEDIEETVPVEVEEAKEMTPVKVDLPEAPAGDALFFLKLHEPPDSEPIPLEPGKCVIGRARGADITVEDSSVSRRHALLSIGAKVTVRDLGSRNHTLLDGERVEGEVEVPAGSTLRFGALDTTLLAGRNAE